MENKEVKSNSLWLLFGLAAFVIAGTVAAMLHSFLGDKSPTYLVVLAGGLVMLFSFWMATKSQRAAAKQKDGK